MSKLHIMNGDGGNRFTAICHAPTPAGNNAAGVSWAVAIRNGVKPVSIMTEGNAAGQIATAEANQVANGDVIEVSFQFDDDPTWNDVTRNAQITAIANDAVTRSVNEVQARLKYFGKVVA